MRYDYESAIPFVSLMGKVFASIEKSEDEITFVVNDDEAYALGHEQDCCEEVKVEDICGDLDDLIGLPILLAEEVTSEDNRPEECYGSHTWTFYKLSTNKGSVTIRWIGLSNGYYSESVSLYQTKGFESCAS
jgi:hypothetical protein